MFSLGGVGDEGKPRATLDELQVRRVRAVSGGGCSPRWCFLPASCALSGEARTLTSVKQLALGVVVVRTLPPWPPQPLFVFAWTVAKASTFLVPAALSEPSCSICAHCFWFSQRSENLRENGVLGSVRNCSRSTKGILEMGTDAGSEGIGLILALALRPSPQQQLGFEPSTV